MTEQGLNPTLSVCKTHFLNHSVSQSLPLWGSQSGETEIRKPLLLGHDLPPRLSNKTPAGSDWVLFQLRLRLLFLGLRPENSINDFVADTNVNADKSINQQLDI